MKILYIGTYKELSGWGEASRGDLRALIEKFDVVCRPIIYSAGAEVLSLSGLDEIENRPLDNITHVLQYCLPEQWKRYGTMKHIGYLEIESNDLSRSRWPDYFNMVDEIWVPNSESINVIKKFFNGPVKYVPHAVDLSVYEKSYQISEIPELLGTFKFFCASENVPRKNLEQLVAAYWAEFDPTEPTSLVLKTHDNIIPLLNNLKKKLRLYDFDAYQKIFVISNKLTTPEMMGLFQSCDCYVNVSMGESWCLPIVHAMGFKKPIISPMHGGPNDLLKKYKPLFEVASIPTWCEGHNSNIKGFQTGHDWWRAPMFDLIKGGMRSMYENKNQEFSSNLMAFSKERFCENVGKLL